MPRTSSAHQLMARLALLAVLLMAFSPALTRLASGGTLQLLPGLVELCTVDGLKQVNVTDAAGISTPLPVGVHAGMDADCAYCPLLAATALLLLAMAMLFPQAPLRLVQAGWLHGFRQASVFPGLGSRGPPIAL